MATFVNHYNSKLNKCFIETFTHSIVNKDLLQQEYLDDAFEKKQYGMFAGFVGGRMVACSVTSSSGANVKCNSSDEFDSLIKPYLEQ